LLRASRGPAALIVGRAHRAEALLQHRPAVGEIRAPRQDVAHPRDIGAHRVGARQRRGDVGHRLAAVLADVAGMVVLA
jgi:hypothetical protein